MIVELPNPNTEVHELYIFECNRNLDEMVDAFRDDKQSGICLFRLKERIHNFYGNAAWWVPLKVSWFVSWLEVGLLVTNFLFRKKLTWKPKMCSWSGSPLSIEECTYLHNSPFASPLVAFTLHPSNSRLILLSDPSAAVQGLPAIRPIDEEFLSEFEGKNVNKIPMNGLYELWSTFLIVTLLELAHVVRVF